MFVLLWLVALAAVATALVWAGSLSLERSAERLARYYGLPPIVQGAVIAAVGSSFPELSSVVIATVRYGEFELGVAAIVGSAVFNVLVIPALATLFHRDTMESNRAIVYREAQFYIIAVATLLLTFSLAVIYFPTGTGLFGEVTRPLALFPLGLYGLYLFIQYQESAEFQAAENAGDVHGPKQWALLAVGLAVILVGVEVLVHAAVELGAYFDTPSFLWGLTVIAAGTSLPDTIISVRAAQRGQSSVSLANVFGSNVFDLLVAVPVGVLIAGSTPIDFGVAAPLMGFLVVATIVVFATARTDFALTDREAWLLLAVYAAFVGWMLLESTGVTGVVL
ncbi:sodium:calcium antiporter [Natronolimnohabitans innermongolicus]|uniref:Sodium/calcium exchanger membrane region n=1 Tax=Natronolimnohabitans innermongolicus JCM 12255 TaxID=1227499 RepID=L9XIR9_9EURY|nr:sodium:calcium antiporter [Natronolimnohabitans innermongolicus]ELY61644.1 sodium/calcium exchanger membrane region [Natronolimnohabitans innermongolicus JCM 12255]